jgi:hypothetical protein
MFRWLTKEQLENYLIWSRALRLVNLEVQVCQKFKDVDPLEKQQTQSRGMAKFEYLLTVRETQDVIATLT